MNEIKGSDCQQFDINTHCLNIRFTSHLTFNTEAYIGIS